MKRLLLWTWVMVLLLAACGAPAPAVSPLQTSPIASPSPPDSPVSATALPMGPAFALGDPIREGDTTITGTGGPNVPINIIDISMSGVDIAVGKVGNDGKFSLPVTGNWLKAITSGSSWAISLVPT